MRRGTAPSEAASEARRNTIITNSTSLARLGRVGESKKDKAPIGMPGTVELLNSRVISTQPIVSFDWSDSREGLCVLSCLDQTLRVFICTKLNKY